MPRLSCFRVVVFLSLALCLSGCRLGSTPEPDAQGTIRLSGTVHGGQQPVTGATLQLYAVGTSGDGSSATPLITKTVTTDAYGSFNLSTDYTCPVPDTNVYLVATGGNPGMTSGTNNRQLAMMAALGSCAALGSSTSVFLNELTTVGSIAALYPYASGYASIGSATGDETAFAAAFGAVNEYTNTATGVVPGPMLPANTYASSTEIDTLANILAACINSGGGQVFDGSACGRLFAAVPIGSGFYPTDTIGALIDILKYPTTGVSSIYSLNPGTGAPYQPSLLAAPTTWALPIVAAPMTPVISLAGGTYLGTQMVTISDATSGAVIYYTLDGSVPTTASAVYGGAISVASSMTVTAFAELRGILSSSAVSASYVITPTPSSLTAMTGSGQSAEVSTGFATALQVLVQDGTGKVFPNAVVSFTAPVSGAGASLSSPTCMTNSSGLCAVTAMANGVGGTYSVTASTTAASTSFTLTNTGLHAYLVTVGTDTTTGVAGNCVDQSAGAQGSNANCSLRDAMAAAAANATSSAAATITFAQRAATTITLANGTLNVPSNTTIQGATSGAGPTLTNLITVDGNGDSSVFTEALGVVAAAINNLSITEGSSSVGAGIFTSGTLTLNQDTFYDNEASASGGAIGNFGGVLTVTNSTFNGNVADDGYGGGIDNYSLGVLNVANSTFTANNAKTGDGGAIYTHGTATIVDSTISGNKASYGAGIYNLVTLSVINSIVNGNNNEDCGGVDCDPIWAYVQFSAVTSTPVDSNSITLSFTDSQKNSFSQTAAYGELSTATGVAGVFGPYFFENFSGLDTTAITGESFGTLLVISPENSATLSPITITNPGQSFSAVQVYPANPLVNNNNVHDTTKAAANLSALGNYGGPTQTMVPLTASTALCVITPSTATGTDQRGQPRAVTSGATTCQDAGAVQTSF